MLEAQGGVCAICRTGTRRHVDHDHATGAVRALLCFNCNGGLGQFRDDPCLLHAAALYVEHHRQQQAIDGLVDGGRRRRRRAASRRAAAGRVAADVRDAAGTSCAEHRADQRCTPA